MSPYRTALIVGAGSGLSASLARLFGANGMKVALASRNPSGSQPGGGDRRQSLRLRRDQARAGGEAVHRGRGEPRRAGHGRLQRELPLPRP